MISKFRERLQKIIYSIKNITGNPVESLGYLIPVVMYLITTVTAVGGYIMFVRAGEYTKQISVIKELGVEKAFTSGTRDLLIKGSVPVVICILAFLQLTMALIIYFRSEEKAKQVVMIIDLLVFMACLLIFGGLGMRNAWVCRVVTTEMSMPALLIGILAFILLFGLTIHTESCVMLIDLIKNLIFHFIIMPLGVVLLENVIPLAVGALTVMFFCFVIFSMFNAFGEAGDGAGGSYVDNSRNKIDKKDKHETGKRIEITDYGRAGGNDLYKKHGALSDDIILDNHIVTRSLCSIAEMKSGKCRLYDKASGKEIKLEEIPWKNS